MDVDGQLRTAQITVAAVGATSFWLSYHLRLWPFWEHTSQCSVDCKECSPTIPSEDRGHGGWRTYLKEYRGAYLGEHAEHTPPAYTACVSVRFS